MTNLERWFSEISPLSIPNREDKPARADGTELKPGTVRRCLSLSKIAFSKMEVLFLFSLF